MAISIDWLNKIVMIPRVDMLLVQASPTEIRELDLINFHSILRILEAEYTGILYTPTHNYKGPLSVGGVTLAAVIEVINNYTILFEDGQYAVNLVNANSNVGDRVNVNQVSVRSANSAGLTNVREIQAASYQGAVALDTTNGIMGTTFPIGTHASPSNNLVDATFIADLRGLEVVVIRGVFNVLAGANLKGRTYRGENAITTSIVIHESVVVEGSQIEDMFIYNSTLSGSVYIKHCALRNISSFTGFMENSLLSEGISLTSNSTSYFVDCKSGCVGLGTSDLPIINLMGTGIHTAFRNWAGPIKFINSVDVNNTLCVDVASGATIILDSSCTQGTIFIRGIADIVNNSSMAVVMVDALSPNGINDISNAIWNKVLP